MTFARLAKSSRENPGASWFWRSISLYQFPLPPVALLPAGEPPPDFEDVVPLTSFDAPAALPVVEPLRSSRIISRRSWAGVS